MRVLVEKPGSPGDILEHTGRKGMKWGVRKESTSTSTSSSSSIKGLEHYSKSQAISMNNVAKSMEKAYGFKVHEFVPLTEAENHQYLTIVMPKGKGDERNVVRVTNHPKYKSVLDKMQKQGWFVSSVSGRSIESNLTHEVAHGLFHANDASGKGVIRNKNVLIAPLRKSAWKKAEEQAIKDGDIIHDKSFKKPYGSQGQMSHKISGYAHSSPFIEEHEAELFTAYHWSPNPPKFVDVFMNDIHSNMGIEVKPFSGRKPHA